VTGVIQVEIVFIFSLLLIAYAYLGYPALVFLLSRIRERPVRKADISPKVSVIIAAHNEERDIAMKIENTLGLDYPREKLEIIVASDCSTDATDEIARAYADRGLILHRQHQRLGKTMAQNAAVEVSSGEVLVFTDATTGYQSDALRKLVRSFADSEVGCVSSQLIYVDRTKTTVGLGCRSYWRFEQFVRDSESRLGSMIGVTGCLYAVRRSSYSPLGRDMCSDFVIASEIHMKGLRTIDEREAIAIEDTNNRSRDEFRMRVRIMEQTMSALSRYREVLSIRHHGIFAFQLLSHKVLRYSVAALLLVALISNLLIVNQSPVYQATMALQTAFYVSALAGWLLTRFGARVGPLAIPYYFVLANMAVIVAFIKHVRGENHILWEPLRGAGRSNKQMAAVRAEGGSAR
jgi:cellulose synthase/poly-beta-1,6-N-acetylglucosamine synthase-like glycosyltransferase